MMAASLKCLDELEQLSENKSLVTQRQFLKRVTDLFFITEKMQGEEENRLFGRVMLQVLGNVDIESRKALATRLAKSDKAPRQVISQLASDSIDIAEPVLRHSTAMSDEVLLNIIDNKVADHISVICERSQISENVSEALLGQCDDDTMLELVQNTGARFSPSSFDRLIDKASRNEPVRKALLNRADKPDDCFDRIKESLSYTLKSGLVLDNPELSKEKAEELSFAQANRVLKTDQSHSLNGSKNISVSEVQDLHQEGNLTQYNIAEIARNHEEATCISALSLLSGLDEKMVAHILITAEISALSIFCKQLRFSRDSFLALLELKSVKRRMTDQVIHTALKRYDDLTHENAVHIMRFLTERFENII